MLTGEGLHRNRNLLLNFEIAAYAQVISTGENAWNNLLSPGKQTENIYKFNQGHDELFHDDILIKQINWRYRSWTFGRWIASQSQYYCSVSLL